MKVPVGTPPTIVQVGKLYIVKGDPRGPEAHHWCASEKRGVYRTEAGALKMLARLGRAYRARCLAIAPATVAKV